MLPPSRDTAVVHGPIPWRKLLASRPSGCSALQYVCLGYGWWFYITWLPTYLSEARGTGRDGGRAARRHAAAARRYRLHRVGALTPVLARLTNSVSAARRILAVTGFAGASIPSFVFTTHPGSDGGHARAQLASFFNDFVMPPAWAACMDIGGRYSGTVSGAMNMMGGIAGRLLAARRRLPARLDVPRLDRHVLHLGRHLHDGRALLAVPRHADSDRRSRVRTARRVTALVSIDRELDSQLDGKMYASRRLQRCKCHRKGLKTSRSER